jgi:hypothetical protein
MNEREFNDLRELGWRRPLTPAEAARGRQHLAGQRESQAEWEMDAALTQALHQLPDAPLASNFTAQVLHALEREASLPARSDLPFAAVRAWFNRVAPRLAGAVAVVGLASLVWMQYSHQQQQRQFVRSAATILQASTVPNPELLQDFDAISHLSQLPPASDAELLTALSQ